MKRDLVKNPKAMAAYNELCSLDPRRCDKNTKKRVFLFAYEADKELDGEAFGEAFWEEVAQLNVSQHHMLEGTLMTPGRLASFVGAAEAQSMILNNELPTKKNEKNRDVYFYVEEKEQRVASKNKTYQAKAGPIRLRNKEVENALENFELAELTPLSFEVAPGGSMPVKRPASALCNSKAESAEGNVMKKPATKPPKVNSLEEDMHALKALVQQMNNLKIT